MIIDKHTVRRTSEISEDDFNTAKVLAGLFEIVPTINSIKDKVIVWILSSATINRMKQDFHVFIEEILGLKNEWAVESPFKEVMNLLASIRKDARSKRDFHFR